MSQPKSQTKFLKQEKACFSKTQNGQAKILHKKMHTKTLIASNFVREKLIRDFSFFHIENHDYQIDYFTHLYFCIANVRASSTSNSA